MNASKAKILVIHNRYQQAGGEDLAFEMETDLLRERGHQVITYTDVNHRENSSTNLAVATHAVWARDSYQNIRRLIRNERPDLVHFHNTFFMISPSGYYACRAEGVPVVQTLHNYRLMCPAATFYRDGHVCEECQGKKVAYPGVFHGCYHGSRGHTAVVAGTVALHRFAGTWQRQVDIYIALTEFAKKKFIEGGLPAERIFVKPNFTSSIEKPGEEPTGFALFAGRLSAEKGVSTLLKAWQGLEIPLRIAGDGPLAGPVEQARSFFIQPLGVVGHRDMLSTMRKANFLVFPSECYEGLSFSMIEAFSCGLPVIAARTGSASELIKEHITGLHFNPGDPIDLATQVRWAWGHPAEMAEMGHKARQEYETYYTADRNYQMLMELYQKAIQLNPDSDRKK